MEGLSQEDKLERHEAKNRLLNGIKESIEKYRVVQAGLADAEGDVTDADEFTGYVLREEIADRTQEISSLCGRADFSIRFLFDRELACTPIKGVGVQFNRKYFIAEDIQPADGGTIRLINTYEGTELSVPPEADFNLGISYTEF